MPRIEKAQLLIHPVVPGAGLWRVEVSWVLAVPYWELGSWCSETLELFEGEKGAGGAPVVSWHSPPWQIKADASPVDCSMVHIERHLPAQLVGPAVLDVAPDHDLVEMVPAEIGPGVLIRVSRVRRLDRVHVKVHVEPVVATGDAFETESVTGQFGAPP